MNANFIVGLGTEVMWLTVKLIGPILLVGLIAGLLVSIFQVTTQIQDQTLAFVPKIAAVVVALLVFGPWMLTNLVDFAREILNNLMQFVQ